jgi:hypothetical protein
MDKESVERLRYDRRLQRRTGWLDSTDSESYLASLPDVSEKMTTGADEENVAEAAPSAPTTPSTPSTPSTPAIPATSTTPAPAAVAGDFSGSRSFGGLRDGSGES